MKIIRLELNLLRTNTYFLINEVSKETVIIDPAWDCEEIDDVINNNGLKIAAVLLTHGHADHIYGVNRLQERGIKVIASVKETDLLKDSDLNLSYILRKKVNVVPDDTVQDGDMLSLAGFNIRVYETPGHTEGSVCYEIVGEKVIFTGDTLFYGSVGRTDFPSGSDKKLRNSVRNILFLLPEEFVVYPGHGEKTSIGFEKKYNSIL